MELNKQDEKDPETPEAGDSEKISIDLSEAIKGIFTID